MFVVDDEWIFEWFPSFLAALRLFVHSNYLYLHSSVWCHILYDFRSPRTLSISFRLHSIFCIALITQRLSEGVNGGGGVHLANDSFVCWWRRGKCVPIKVYVTVCLYMLLELMDSSHVMDCDGDNDECTYSVHTHPRTRFKLQTTITHTFVNTKLLHRTFQSISISCSQQSWLFARRCCRCAVYF